MILSDFILLSYQGHICFDGFGEKFQQNSVCQP